MRKHGLWFCGIVAIVLTSGTGAAQGIKSGVLTRDALPPGLAGAVDALGVRVVRPGNERVVATGTFVKGSQRKAYRITRELPNKVRIEDLSGPGRAVFFDGDSPGASDLLSEDDLDTAESLGEDSAEASLYYIQSGAAVRFLGGRFQIDRSEPAKYAGPWLAIYESCYSTKLRSAKDSRRKQLVFDEASRLLQYVRYSIARGGETVSVLTEWSGWRNIGGQTFPFRVARRENGVEVWSFSQDDVTTGPAKGDNAFSH